jgi:RNA polymerase sigma-70 factor (ECF subfamily)
LEKGVNVYSPPPLLWGISRYLIKNKTMETKTKNMAEDLKLVEAIKGLNKRESEKAFERLYKKYYHFMFFNFLKMVKNREFAEDITIQVFSKINKNIDKYDSNISAFSTWLFMLAKNVAIDNIRKEKCREFSFSDIDVTKTEEYEQCVDIACSSKNPEEFFLAEEKKEILHKAILLLKDKKIIYFIKLRYFDGLSYKEMSELTNMPIGTVKANIFRAKKMLKEKLKDLKFEK